MTVRRSRSSKMLRVAAAVLLAGLLVIAVIARRSPTTGPADVEPPSTTAPATEVADLEEQEIEPVGDAPVRVSVQSKPSAPASREAPSQSNKLAIVGEIRDPSGSPIDAEVARLWYRTSSGTKTTAIVGGKYRIAGLDPGKIGLECKIRGYRPQLRRIVLRSGESEHREDFVLDPDWFVDVDLVTPDGRKVDPSMLKELLPEGGVGFGVSDSPPPERWVHDSFEEQRARRLVGVDWGGDPEDRSFRRLAIHCEPPAYLSLDVHGYVLATTRLDTRVDRVALELQPDRIPSLRCSFTCRVIDQETGAPFAKAFATLAGAPGGSVLRLEADETGRFGRADLLPGHCRLSLRGVGSEWSARAIRCFDLEPGSEMDLGTIALEPSLHVRGRFVDSGGLAVAGKGSIQSLSIDEPVDEMFGDRLDGGRGGAFQRDGLGKDRYGLVVYGRPWGQPKGDLLFGSFLVDLRDGSIDDLVVRMECAYPVCIRPEVEEAKDFTYRIVDAAGIPCARGDLAQPHTHWLAPGDYRALVGPDASHMREIPFTHGFEALTVKVEP